MNAAYVGESLDNKLVEQVREILKPILNKDWGDFKSQN